MNYIKITKNDIANGPGVRVTLWVSGCNIHCKGCHNPQTHDPAGGAWADTEDILFAAAENPLLDGITFSGGDPLFAGNRSEVERLARKVRTEYPEKNIWLYTGYRWEEVSALPVMQYIDVLVDGKFAEDLKNSKLHWKGSFNQRIVDVQKSLKNSALYLYPTE